MALTVPILTHIITLILGILIGIISLFRFVRRETEPKDGPIFPGEDASCPVCLVNNRSIAFQCGHTLCHWCSTKMNTCPICRSRVTKRLRLYA